MESAPICCVVLCRVPNIEELNARAEAEPDELVLMPTELGSCGQRLCEVAEGLLELLHPSSKDEIGAHSSVRKAILKFHEEFPTAFSDCEMQLGYRSRTEGIREHLKPLREIIRAHLTVLQITKVSYHHINFLCNPDLLAMCCGM
jgi:hypothetical protein